MWIAKENNRRILAEKYLIGPKGITGFRAADYVDNYIRNYSIQQEKSNG